MTTRPPYKKRLQQHLKETKGHARAVERRIKQLGGTAEELSVPGPTSFPRRRARSRRSRTAVSRSRRGRCTWCAARASRRNCSRTPRREFSDEAEEIANYTAIETLAESVGDKETAKIARGIRREEERMSSFLERLIPQLTKAVAQAEIPASERNGTGSRRKTSSRSGTGSRRKATSRRKTTARRGTTSRRKTTARRGTTSRRKTTARRGTTAKRRTRARA